MNKWLERTLWFAFIVIMSTVSFVTARSGANTTIDNAQATSAALQNSLNELLGVTVTQPPDLSGELATLVAANSTIAAHNEQQQMTETARYQPTLIPNTSTPNHTQTAALFFTAITPTLTPTQIPNCFPSNIIEVVVTRIPHLDLWDTSLEWHYTDSNGDRVRYTIGQTFFIYEELVETDDGDRFYQVFGPRGHGLFVGEGAIKLFNDNPDLVYCN